LLERVSDRSALYDFLKDMIVPLATPFSEPIKYYQSDFNYFQWIDTKSDWYVCDVFGKVTLVGKMPDYDTVRFLSPQSFLLAKDGKLSFHDANNNTAQTISGLDNSLKNFYYQAQILAIFTSSGITNYKIILP